MNFPPVPIPWLNVSWSLFLLLAVLAFLAVSGFSLTIGLGAFLVIAVLCVLRFPYASLYLAFCSLLLSGIIVPISTGTIQIGDRAFGASIEVTLGELMTVVVMIGWALRLLLARDHKTQTSARPWLPLGFGFLALIVAHLLSVFSPAQPDPLLVFKYTLRPLLFVYIAALALPANFLRSWRRMDEACVAFLGVAGWFTLDAVRSLFIFQGDAFGIYRAHPLTFFGVNPLGGNHHALAELMVLVAPLALALRERTQDHRVKRALLALAGIFWLVALLTFARAAWFVVALQVGIYGVCVWRDWVRLHLRALIITAFFLSPLGLYMVWLSLGSAVGQSTSARTLLIDMAWSFFRDSPWVGVGAGTFVERVAHVWAFTVEYGAAQDAHGLVQKLGAETGLFGLTAFVFLLWLFFKLVRGQWRLLTDKQEQRWFVCMGVSAVGVLTYQLFSTSLWSPRVWLSIGFLCAGMRLLRTQAVRRDPDFLRT